MRLRINKKILLYMVFWFICLLPNDVIRLFPSYETYFQYLLQAALGTILLYKYKISKNINIFQIILLIWLLLYLPGAFLNGGLKTVTLIKYFCWIIFAWGVLRFFEIEKENEIFMCLKAARPTFFIYMLLTYISMPSRATAEGGVFFLGSRATTLQYFLCLLAMCIFCDLRFYKKLTVFTGLMWILSWLFAILRGSGQGMMMLFTISLLLILEKSARIKLMKRIKPIYIIAGIIIVNYLMITLSYMNFSLVIDVIQDILHKDATLTGRSEIFTYSLAIFLQHPIWGYGFDNNIVEATLTKIVAAYNTAHNSILQMLINCGIIGTAFFLLSNYIAFSYINKSHNNALSVMYYALIAMFVGGVVSMIIPSNSFLLILLFAAGRAKYSPFEEGETVS